MLGVVSLRDPCTSSFATVCAESLAALCLGPCGCTSGPVGGNPGQWLSVWYQVANHKTRFVKIKLVRSALLEF